MISYINIQNIALIRELSLELKPGLNVLSGETGAGKSIIIDSINFVLGDRADRSLIRHGETSARAEVVFDGIADKPNLMQMLAEYGIDCEDGFVAVSRVMTSDKSECRINGRLVNLSILRSIVSLLVDIHSQNEHQSLLKVSNHIKILDNFNSNIKQNREYFAELLSEYRNICAKIDNFSSLAERERKIDLYTYQLEEIERVALKENEEETLTEERNRFYNAQKIFDSTNAAVNNLDGAAGGINSLRLAVKSLSEIEKYDNSLTELISRIDTALIELSDVADSLKDKLYQEENSPVDIERVERRINDIRQLKRKYGKDLTEIEAFRQRTEEELNMLLSAESAVAALEKKKAVLCEKLIASAQSLHAQRAGAAVEFSAVIQENLRELGMKNSLFEVKVSLSEDILADMNPYGADSVEFLLSPNLGEPVKPLVKIASGGETSRFMLALKSAIAKIDEIGALIFDEIDTGISGVIAKVVASKLYDIAKSRQVIAITHLPQLAAMADVNYLIEKRVEGEKTLTAVTTLTEDGIYSELMRLSGGVENSASALASAKELKAWANVYKSR